MREIALAFLALIFTTGSLSAQALGTKPDEQTVKDAYIYLLGRALTIRQEHMDRGGQGFSYNAIKYNPLGSADFVNPNFDVAYLEAWVAVDENTPAILEVPEVRGRYYTAQILDEWGEVVANINERIFPSKPFGKFALLKPGSHADIPADASPIYLHSSKAKLLGRVERKGDDEGAVRLQKQFKLSSAGTPRIADPPAIPTFNNETLIGVEIFDDLDGKLSSALDVSPNAASMQQKARAVAAYAGSSPDARAAIDAQIKKIVPDFRVYAVTQSAPTREHWTGGMSAGNYGANFWLRTSVNYAGIWANSIDEVTYFVASSDSEGQPLNGSNSYVIHFPAENLPDKVVGAYWSVILVSVPDYRVVPNSLNRFNFNNHSPLQKEADGSLKIGLGAKQTEGVPESNWLPAPEGKPFSLTFRTYVPKDIVRRGQWQPAAVTMVK